MFLLEKLDAFLKATFIAPNGNRSGSQWERLIFQACVLVYVLFLMECSFWEHKALQVRSAYVLDGNSVPNGMPQAFLSYEMLPYL